MSTSDSKVSDPSPRSLLDLPLEIRQLIYHHVLDPVIILPSIPCRRAAFSNRSLEHPCNSYAHPAPLNPLVYGIANPAPRWRIPTRPYPNSSRTRVVSTRYQPRALPIPLQLTCKQIYNETVDYALSSGTWTFAFSSFQSLIKWLKGRDGRRTDLEAFLRRVGSVLIETELDVLPSANLQQQEAPTRAPEDAPDETDLQSMIPEAQLPWLDALGLLTRLCPFLHTLGLHVSLSGPEIQVIHFGALPQPGPVPAGGENGGSVPAPASTSPYAANPPPQDWPPGSRQPRADFGPVVARMVGYVKRFKWLRRCAVTVRAGHALRNLAADPGDASLWARAWADEDVDGKEVGGIGAMIGEVERGLESCVLDREMVRGAETDVAEARRRMLAVRGRDQYWY